MKSRHNRYQEIDEKISATIFLIILRNVLIIIAVSISSSRIARIESVPYAHPTREGERINLNTFDACSDTPASTPFMYALALQDYFYPRFK